MFGSAFDGRGLEDSFAFNCRFELRKHQIHILLCWAALRCFFGFASPHCAGLYIIVFNSKWRAQRERSSAQGEGEKGIE